MRRATKAMMVAGGVLAVTASTLIGTGMASAHSSANQSTLISKIAQKFGLNESDVKAVFDEERAARDEEMKANMEERLTQAVTDGKITEEQKTQILAKLDELQAFRDSLEGKTDDEKREAMKTKMDEMRTWAQENNIPKRYFMMRGTHGHGGGRHMMDKDDSSMSTSEDTSAEN